MIALPSFQEIISHRVELSIIHDLNYQKKLLGHNLYLPKQMQSLLLKRKCEFLAGRWCAVKAMQLLGVQGVSQPLIGKYNEPVWPKGVMGSISHTHRTAVAITIHTHSQIQGIGIDREKLINIAMANRFANKILSAKEQTLGCAFFNFELFVTIGFSCKEALFKAIFPQILRVVNFDVAQITQINLKDKMVELTIKQNLSENLYIGRKVQAFYQEFSGAIESYVIV
ncbi:4'-phosphopantetheinyl transferase [Rheinheimera sp. MMS21-TC3]|uniref:4'-phosphopantetheinyl transferase family protein n=1 Tax=Rheinheimera sp. MMS21-TC3 TaxID=3072790 RepID=UPI0028C37E00|nr:4'-phosphopantetheinyl transferase superfamily protein [Rheinheimera sp. MMS21-TC3]WNO60632.1 4'-phosphopantetheinyl transferase superfamily protein [Rheinheimera sp. MMS21-TC3]